MRTVSRVDLAARARAVIAAHDVTRDIEYIDLMVLGIKTDDHHVVGTGLIDIGCAHEEGKVIADALAGIDGHRVTIFSVDDGLVVLVYLDLGRLDKVHGSKGCARKQKSDDGKNQQNHALFAAFLPFSLGLFPASSSVLNIGQMIVRIAVIRGINGHIFFLLVFFAPFAGFAAKDLHAFYTPLPSAPNLRCTPCRMSALRAAMVSGWMSFPRLSRS